MAPQGEKGRGREENRMFAKLNDIKELPPASPAKPPPPHEARREKKKQGRKGSRPTIPATCLRAGRRAGGAERKREEGRRRKAGMR